MFKVSLQEFSGPLELLIYFIQKEEIHPDEIPVSLIIEDFKHYIENIIKNLDELGDFILMLSVLIDLKLRKLLPIKEKSNEEDIYVSIEEITEEYLKYKNAAKILYEKQMEVSNMLPRGNYKISPEPEPVKVDILKKIFYKLLKEKRVSPSFMEEEPLKIEEFEKRLKDIIQKEKKVSFRKLLKIVTSFSEVILLFFLILEMIRKNEIVIQVKDSNGDVLSSTIEIK